MIFDTCLFDLDGTLTDSAPGILHSVIFALEKNHAPVPPMEILRQFIGPPLIDSFEKYCQFSHESAVQALMDYREYFTRCGGMFENRVYDGVVDALARLANQGVRLIVATSKPEEFARKILDHFDLSQYFAEIHGATMDEQRSHKKDVIAWALSHSGELGRVVMVGDRANDIEGAIANHIDAIGVLYGYGSMAELRSAGAEMLASTPDEIVSLVFRNGSCTNFF